MAGVGRYARAGAARRAFAAPVGPAVRRRCAANPLRAGCGAVPDRGTAALAARPAEPARARGDPLLRRRALAQGSRATDGDFADDRAPLPALRVPQARHARQEPDRRRARRNGQCGRRRAGGSWWRVALNCAESHDRRTLHAVTRMVVPATIERYARQLPGDGIPS